MLNELIKEVMTWNEYPSQTPSWCGWEYVPKDEVALKLLCRACGYDWWEGVEFGCLQYSEDTNKFIVYVDGNVWEVSREEFTKILEQIKK